MQQNITELTPNGMVQLIEKKQENVVLQIIAIKSLPKKENQTTRYRVYLSDGFASTFVLFINDAASVMEKENLQQNAVILVTKSNVSSPPSAGNQLVILIAGIQPIYPNIKEQIGLPVDYVKYKEELNYTNKNGSNKIPPSEIGGLASGFDKSSKIGGGYGGNHFTNDTTTASTSIKQSFINQSNNNVVQPNPMNPFPQKTAPAPFKSPMNQPVTMNGPQSGLPNKIPPSPSATTNITAKPGAFQQQQPQTVPKPPFAQPFNNNGGMAQNNNNFNGTGAGRPGGVPQGPRPAPGFGGPGTMQPAPMPGMGGGPQNNNFNNGGMRPAQTTHSIPGSSMNSFQANQSLNRNSAMPLNNAPGGANRPPYGNGMMTNPNIGGGGGAFANNNMTKKPPANNYYQSNMNETYTPISSLTQWNSDWVIKARITMKSTLRNFNNSSGREGKVFSINLIDASQGEIQASFFNEAADKWYGPLKENQVYLFKNGQVRPSKGNKFSSVKNDVQINFDQGAEIEEINDDQSIGLGKFDFATIDQIERMPVETTIDFIGVIKEVHPTSEITLRNTGQQKTRRNMVVFDVSQLAIDVTMWGNFATQFDYEKNTIIIIKGARVGEYNKAKNISTGFQSIIYYDTTLPYNLQEVQNYMLMLQNGNLREDEVRILHGDGGGAPGAGMKRDPKTIKEIEDECQKLGTDEKRWYDLICFVNYIKQDTYLYIACPKCSKKVISETNGWRCESCNTIHETPQAKFFLTARVSDSTGEIYVKIGDKPAQVLFGMTANDVRMMKEQNESAFKELFSEKSKFTEIRVQIQVKWDFYNNNNRLSYQVQNLSFVNFKETSLEYLKLLEDA